jgi:hypothetical protein
LFRSGQRKPRWPVLIKHILLLPLLSLALSAPCQWHENLQKFDSRPYHFGFAFSYNSADFYLDQVPDFTFKDSLMSLLSVKQPGFNIGMLFSLRITDNTKLRFTIPTFSFQDKVLEYRFLRPNSKTETIVKRVQSTYLNFPIGLKFRTNRAGNFAAYFLVGAKYGIDIASQKKVNNSGNNIILKLQKTDYSFEVGGGVDFFFPFFKAGLELKLATGLKNLLIQDNTTYSTPISRLRSKVWVFTLTLEG